MQLRHYFAILRRFWLPIVLLPLLVGIISLYVELTRPQRYGATARLMITQSPRGDDPTAMLPDFNLNYSWASSEFILDDLPQVVTSAAFARDVITFAERQGYALTLAEVQSGLGAATLHRSITLSSNADTPEKATAILQGAVEALQTNGLRYWNRSSADDNGLSVAVLDQPGEAVALGSLRRMVFNLGLRVGLALAAAVGLAFLLYYLDDTLREPRQVEEWTGVQVVGVIPKE